MARRLVVLAGFGCALALSAACGPTHAQTPGEDVPLSTPAAPPRVVVPVTIDTPAPPEPSKPASQSAPPGHEAPPQTAARPATTTSATPPATTPPPQADPPAPILQTTANVTEAGVRGVILKAQGDLARVDYRSLSADSKAQYDQAKRFIEQAESAVKVKNVVFAEQLASKAATLASSLVKRR